MTIVKRAAVLGALLLVPTPAHAHTVGGESGVEIEFALLALVAMLAGFGLLGSASVRSWIPFGLMGIGVLFFGAALTVPRLGGEPSESNAVVSIARPRPGSRVPAGKPVQIQVEVAHDRVARSPTDASGGHLHLFVDDELHNMQYSTEAKVKLNQGAHEIRVEFVDFRHVSFDPRVEDVIEVEAR